MNCFVLPPSLLDDPTRNIVVPYSPRISQPIPALGMTPGAQSRITLAIIAVGFYKKNLGYCIVARARSVVALVLRVKSHSNQG
jgi:hypothetical protein